MLKFAVIGHPLTQSLSAVMHNAMLKDLGIDGVYELLDTEPEDLVTRVKELNSSICWEFGFYRRISRKNE